MGNNGIIIKAHKLLLENLTQQELKVFENLTSYHQIFLIDREVKQESKKNLNPTINKIILEDRIITSTTTIKINEKIKKSLELIVKGNNAISECWEEFKRIKVLCNYSKTLDVYDLNRLIYPFDDDLLFDFVYEIVCGDMRPHLYPWQVAGNEEEFFDVIIPDMRDFEERRMFYAELPLDIQVLAKLHIENLKNTRMYQKEVSIWKSYQPPQQRQLKPKTSERYRRWYERYLQIQREYKNKADKFSENKAHEDIAEEEKTDVSTIAKGIKAYLATLESSEISENS
jgi:hypothetical protein